MGMVTCTWEKEWLTSLTSLTRFFMQWDLLLFPSKTRISVCCCDCPAEPVEGAEIEVRSGLVNLFEGNRLELRCKLKAGNHVSYKWLLNGRLVSQSLLHDDRLLINRSVESHGLWWAVTALLCGCQLLAVVFSAVQRVIWLCWPVCAVGNGDFYILCYLVCRQKSTKISKSINLSKKSQSQRSHLNVYPCHPSEQLPRTAAPTGVSPPTASTKQTSSPSTALKL